MTLRRTLPAFLAVSFLLGGALWADDAKSPNENASPAGQRAARVEPVAKVNHRRALLIGINEYKNFRKLKYCGSDVQALGKRLVMAGFEANKVVVVHDEATRSLQPDKKKIVNQIALMLDSAEPGDLVLLAFSGHGVQIQGKSYFAPYEGEAPKSDSDADTQRALKTLISVDWVYEMLRASRASIKLLLADACQNRLFEGEQRSAEKNIVVQDIGRSLEAAPEGILLMTACAAGEYSHESSSLNHGVFSYYLLEALEGKADYNHDGIVSLKEVNLYASSHTEQYVRDHFHKVQRPSFRGRLQGDVPLAECLQMDRITVPDDLEQLDLALRRAADRATIVIKPGVYRYAQPLRITREVTLLGASGDPKDVTLECTDGSAVIVEAQKARIQSVSIRNVTRAAAVSISQGQVELVKCDISAPDSHCVLVTGEKANPRVSHCSLHDSRACGVWAVKKGSCLVEDCDIWANGAGIQVSEEGNPTVKNCKIHDAKQIGIIVNDKGFGTFENCDVAANPFVGIQVAGQSNPTIQGCKVHDGPKGGILVAQNATGKFIGCEVFGNGYAGIQVSDGGNPQVTNCKFHDGRQSGIGVAQGGFGTFEHCETWANAIAGIEVREKSNPTIRHCQVHDGKNNGIMVSKGGFGTFEDCDIWANAFVGIEVREEANPTFKKCTVRDGRKGGVLVAKRGFGTFEDCDFSAVGPGDVNVQVCEDGNPTMKGCKIHDSKGVGVMVCRRGFGTFENCDISSNLLAGVEVKEESNPTVKGCRIWNGRQSGVHVHGAGHGVFEKNTIEGNVNGAWTIEADAGTVARNGNSPES